MIEDNNYPSAWAVTLLSDVVYFQEGPGLRKFQYREEGTPFLNIQTLENERVNKAKCKYLDPEEVEIKYQHFLLETNDIVCSSSGTIGKTAVIREEDKPLMLNTSVIRFRPWVPTLFSREYLHIFLKSQEFISQAMTASTGSAQVNFGPTHLKTFRIPVPPLNEQKRIVAKIEELFSELDNGIAALKTAREQLKVYRQAVLKHAFEGKLTAKWREENADKLESPEQLLARIQQEREARYQQQLEDWKAAVKEWEANGKDGKKSGKPKKAKPVSTALVDSIAIPEKWAHLPVGELNVDVFDGPFGSNLKSNDYVESGVRVIRLENIGEMEFIEEKYSFVTEEKYEQIKKHTVSGGDIIFSSFITEGIRVVILPDSIEKAINKADCFCIRTFGSTYSARFLALYLSSRSAYKQVESEIHGIGRPRINTTQLKSFLVPVCSIEEQQEILSEIDRQISELDATARNIDDQLLKAGVLRQSILKKAFSGQLVSQDPSDEPASELLARIQAERETAQAKAGAKLKPAKKRERKSKERA